MSRGNGYHARHRNRITRRLEQAKRDLQLGGKYVTFDTKTGQHFRLWEKSTHFHWGTLSIPIGAGSEPEEYKGSHRWVTWPFRHWRIMLLIVLINQPLLFVTGYYPGLYPNGGGPLGANPPDPTTGIWTWTGSTDINEFNGVRAAWSNAGGVASSIALTPNATQSAVAISKVPLGDLGIVTGKMLRLILDWGLSGSCCGNLQPWGMYLTSNNTIPTQLNYDPRQDRSVSLLTNVYACVPPGGTFCSGLWIKRNPSDTIAQEDTGSCAAASDCLFFGSGAGGGLPGTTSNLAQTMLNFTGNVGTAACSGSTGNGPGCSWFQSVTNGGNILVGSSQQVPSSNWLTGKYYIGFFAYFGLSSTTIYIHTGGGGCKNDFLIFCTGLWLVVLQPTGTVAPPNIDTGGYLGIVFDFVFNTLTPGGPLLQAAIKGATGTTIGQALSNTVNSILPNIEAQFIGAITSLWQVIANGIELFGNSLGGLFGWGNIGTQFITFINNALTYMTIALGTALNWLVRLISRAVDIVNAIGQWATIYLTGVFNVLADLLNLMPLILDMFIQFTAWFGSSYALAFFLFFVWYVGDEGLAGIVDWFETMKWCTFFAFDIFERMINFGISGITWLIGRLPTFDGTALPELPTVRTGSPTWPSTEMRGLREGNIFSMIFFGIGVIGLFWFETSTLPGSIAAMLLIANPSAATASFTGPRALVTGLGYIIIRLVAFLFPVLLLFKIAGQALNIETGDVIPFPEKITFKTHLRKTKTGKKVLVRTKHVTRTGTGGFKTPHLLGSIRTGVTGVSVQFKRPPGQRGGRLVIQRGLGARGLLPRLTPARAHKVVVEHTREAEKERKITEAHAEAARKQQEKTQQEKVAREARETGERIAREELQRREKEK